jgi:hypothetical protein
VGWLATNAGLPGAFLASAGIGVSLIVLLIPLFHKRLRAWEGKGKELRIGADDTDGDQGIEENP